MRVEANLHIRVRGCWHKIRLSQLSTGASLPAEQICVKLTHISRPGCINILYLAVTISDLTWPLVAKARRMRLVLVQLFSLNLVLTFLTFMFYTSTPTLSEVLFSVILADISVASRLFSLSP